MRKLTIVAVAFLISMCAFAGTQVSGFSKNSPQLKSLGSAFKAHPTIVPEMNPHDITMGYAGEDVSHKPIASHITIA